VAVTIGYNLIEAVVAIAARNVASSAALVAIGLDSTIEVLSAAAVAWQFTWRDPERTSICCYLSVAVLIEPLPTSLRGVIRWLGCRWAGCRRGGVAAHSLVDQVGVTIQDVSAVTQSFLFFFELAESELLFGDLPRYLRLVFAAVGLELALLVQAGGDECVPEEGLAGWRPQVHVITTRYGA
jgi:hypothetical protein